MQATMELQAVIIAGLVVAVTGAWFFFSKRGSGSSAKGTKEFLIKADEMQPGEMKELDAAGTKVRDGTMERFDIHLQVMISFFPLSLRM